MDRTPVFALVVSSSRPFLFGPHIPRSTEFVSWSWSTFRPIPSGQYCSGLNTRERRPEALILTESYPEKNGKLMCVRADGWNEGGLFESAPRPPSRKAIMKLSLANHFDEKQNNNEWCCAGCDPTESLQTATSAGKGQGTDTCREYRATPVEDSASMRTTTDVSNFEQIRLLNCLTVTRL